MATRRTPLHTKGPRRPQCHGDGAGSRQTMIFRSAAESPADGFARGSGVVSRVVAMATDEATEVDDAVASAWAGRGGLRARLEHAQDLVDEWGVLFLACSGSGRRWSTDDARLLWQFDDAAGLDVALAEVVTALTQGALRPGDAVFVFKTAMSLDWQHPSLRGGGRWVCRGASATVGAVRDTIIAAVAAVDPSSDAAFGTGAERWLEGYDRLAGVALRVCGDGGVAVEVWAGASAEGGEDAAAAAADAQGRDAQLAALARLIPSGDVAWEPFPDPDDDLGVVVVLGGGPGVGKGTLGQGLAASLGLTHIPCGDVFWRLDQGQGTEEGQRAMRAIAHMRKSSSELQAQWRQEVAVVVLMEAARLARAARRGGSAGVVLDGAGSLKGPDLMLRCLGRLDLVVTLHAPKDVLLRRIASRATASDRADDVPRKAEKRVSEWFKDCRTTVQAGLARFRQLGVPVVTVDTAGRDPQAVLAAVLPAVRRLVVDDSAADDGASVSTTAPPSPTMPAKPTRLAGVDCAAPRVPPAGDAEDGDAGAWQQQSARPRRRRGGAAQGRAGGAWCA